MQFLLKRLSEKKHIDSTNLQMYEAMRQEYRSVADCVDKISEYYETVTSAKLNEEEKLYLILHINRVCSKEMGA